MREKLQTTRRNLLRVTGVGAGLGLGSSGLLAGGTHSSEAKTSSTVQPSWVIENFEDGDLSEYQFVAGQSLASVTTDSVYDGSHALKIDGGTTKLFRTGFSSAPSQGTNFSCRTKVANGSPFVFLTYGMQDKDNFYAVRLRFDTDKISILKQENDSWSELSGYYPNFSLQRDEWYELEVDWQENGDHVFTATGGGNTATISTTDSTWSSGGLGFWCFASSSSDVIHFDYVVENQRRVDGLELEDFENGNLDEYTIYYGNNAASVTSATSYTRDQALKLADDNVNMANVDAAPAPALGETFSAQVRMSGTPISLLHYGVRDADNFYSLRLKPDNDKIAIMKHEAGGWTELAGQYTSFDLQTDVWYKLELTWGPDGDHTLTVSGDGDSTSLSCTDTTWSSGGIGFMQYGSAGDITYYDSVQMEPFLGNYEVANDGWTSTGTSSLSRKSGDEEPESVTLGNQALEVSVQGESNPSIECQERVVPANCVKNTYLLADVLPADVENSDSHVTFQFRYHHTNPGGVEESPEMTVKQKHGGILAWGLSNLSVSKLDSSDRIEIAWYPSDHPPSSGFDYNGRVMVDNIRLTNDLNEMTQGAFFQKHQELEIAHGLRTDQVIQSQTETTQDGVYKFYDGTEIAYQLKKLENGDIEETVDGDIFRWTGGSA